MINHTVISNDKSAARYFINGGPEAEAISPLIYTTPEFCQFANIQILPATAPELIALLEGFSPDYSIPFRQRYSTNNRRGNEFTLSTDKTISLGACFLPQEMTDRIIAAHRKTTAEIIRLMQLTFSASPSVKHDGTLFSQHAITYDFTHTYNRLNEPHLHSHIVTPNVLWMPELGRFTNCNIRFTFKQKSTLDLLYNLALSERLLQEGFFTEIDNKGFCRFPALIPLVDQYSTPRRMIIEKVRAIEAMQKRPLGFWDRKNIWEKLRPSKPPYPEPQYGLLANYAMELKCPPTILPKRPVPDLGITADLPHSEMIPFLLNQYKAGAFDISEAANSIALIRKGKEHYSIRTTPTPPVFKFQKWIRIGNRQIRVANPKLLKTPIHQLKKEWKKNRTKKNSEQQRINGRHRKIHSVIKTMQSLRIGS